MSYIKKLVIHGFKSFVKKTEIPFTPGINVILGPNGSGKSNISDALCFVLGRLSIKSMRAAKASNLIFLGSKTASPAKEASVEIVFDNQQRAFTIDQDEISIKRIVRRNGQSIYKINGSTNTRQEVLALLAQAGIDPNGFNIILQGEIQNLVRMMGEDRRKIIEEVSGISIYESRKQKSLKELDKTDLRLNEVMAILRERTAYLNNLEKERQQALRFKKLEKDVKRFKASIISQDLNQRKKHSEAIKKQVGDKNKQIEKLKKGIIDVQGQIDSFESKINSINSTIKESAGFEQEKINQEIANLRAEIAGLSVKLENSESKINELQKQKTDIKEMIRENEVEIKQLSTETPTSSTKEKQLSLKKQELEKLEEQRKKFYMTKSELRGLKDRLEDKKSSLTSFNTESNILLKQIESLTLELYDPKSDSSRLEILKTSLGSKNQMLEDLNHRELNLEKLTHTNEHEIDKQNNLIEKISKMDMCPLCKSKITQDHMSQIYSEINPQIETLKKQVVNADKELNEIYSSREILKKDITAIQDELNKRGADVGKLFAINAKKEQLKSLQEKIETMQVDLDKLAIKQKNLQRGFDEDSNIEQKYETMRVSLQEISLRSSETIDSEVSFKERELERNKIQLKQVIREETDIKEDLESIQEDFDDKEGELSVKRGKEEELQKKYHSLIKQRDDFQKKIREAEYHLSLERNKVHNAEQEINNLKINLARVDAEVENLEVEMLSFPGVELVKGSKEALSERLAKTEDFLSRIGTVNLRSLEVYEEVKKEYDSIKDKTEIIEKEKHGILKIIHEIDIKKKKAFVKTFNSLNEVFNRNFSQLSSKGEVTLDLENRKDPFEGGVGITVKTGHGKYFDVKSLSGGEQTLVALSLIFAIQELNPYYFYVLDEIDAALDKKNSERLAGLLKKYMRKGQYIVISHNDEVITNATNLYGVSMHDGISKLISLKV